MPKQRPRRKRQREQSEFKEVVLKIDRVNRVVKGGRRLRFRATVAIGNEKGLVGLGVGKSEEVANAVKKAVAKAKRNMQKVQIVNDTIAHQTEAKFKGSKVIIIPAKQGTGVIAGGAVRAIADLAGIKNILSKSHGSSNKINSAKATLLALASLKEVDVPVAPKTEEKKDSAKKAEQKKKDTEKKAEDKKAVPKENPQTKAVKKEDSTSKKTDK